MNFNTMYKTKLTTPDEAVKFIKSGDWVDYGIGANVPFVLDKALADRADQLEDINVRILICIRPLEIMKANDILSKRVFTLNSWHFTSLEREYAKKGYAFYIPVRYVEVPDLYRCDKDIEQVDVLMIQVAPMDKNGFFNFGPSNSHIIEIAKRAKYTVLEVNDHMPIVNGLYDESIHISEVDAIVEYSSELSTISNPKPDKIDHQIASLILNEISNGATLQLGIGGMPNAVGELIASSDLKDIGIHSEFYVDSIMRMTKAGIVNGSRKSINRGKQVFTFAIGSSELYEYMNENSQLLSAPVDYVNSPSVIASIDNFISINNAIEIDIYGQVNAESVGFRHISGTGGQLDFMIGAYNSFGGKSFIALSSTYTNRSGQVKSRIIPNISQSRVTDPYTAVHYVVTEYGMFNLKGKASWQRAEGLINIAHPDYRDDLIQAAEKQGIWRQSNKR